jgi:hypothetical protein
LEADAAKTVGSMLTSSLHPTPQSDSGLCEPLLERLAAAPVVLVDARAEGTAEHAGFDEVAAAGEFGGIGCTGEPGSCC